jgi:6-pyruvoyltetrahydropterin/6-carboxytetrahydropterin synthase
LTRRVAFHALHRMVLPKWGEEESRSRFGWTADAPGHGHLYRVAVSVGGVLDTETGMLMDLGVLDEIIEQEVVGRFAGTHLNASIPSVFDGKMLPTCEALACEIWQSVAPKLPDQVTLERVIVAEDDTLEAECTG